MAIIKGNVKAAPKSVVIETEVDLFKKANVQQFDETENLGVDVMESDGPGAVIVTNRDVFRKGMRGRKSPYVGATVVGNLLTEIPLSELRKYAEALLTIADEADAAGLQ